MERPQELDRVQIALIDFQQVLADSVPRLELSVAVDKKTNEADSTTIKSKCGVYVLFCPTGEVARVGEAPTTFRKRLPAYEMHRQGWFEFRWVAVVPFPEQFKFLIPALERFLLRKLDSPKNKNHK